MVHSGRGVDVGRGAVWAPLPSSPGHMANCKAGPKVRMVWEERGEGERDLLRGCTRRSHSASPVASPGRSLGQCQVAL